MADEPYDFDTMTREELIAALKNELHDIGTLCDNLATIYEWASGGVVSKPMTDPHAVIQIAEERFTREWKEDASAPDDAIEDVDESLEGWKCSAGFAPRLDGGKSAGA
jgi:hypothetical protein